MENIENKIPNGENQDTQNSSFFSENVSSSNGLEPKLRFKEFDGKWSRNILGNCCDIIMGQSPDSSSYNNNCIGLPLVQGNADMCERIATPQRYTSQPTKICEAGSIILSVRAPVGTVGKTFQKICLGRGVCGITSKNIEFMYQYLLNNENSWRHIEQGGTFTAINSDDIKSFPIILPSLPEQKKIADFLSLIDQRIEKQRQLVENLKKYKRGLFLKLYNDSDKSIISFKNIYEMASEGGTPSTSDSENYENGKIPFIKIDDLNQHYLNFAKYFITEKGLKKSSAWIVPENSIIYSNGATIGACSINKIPVTTKQGILGIVPKSNFSVEFLYFFFTSSIFKQKIKAITTKGTMDCAYLKDINGIKISIPDFIAQQKIAKIMVDFENLIERTELSFIYLQNIKKALLQQMFI